VAPAKGGLPFRRRAQTALVLCECHLAHDVTWHTPVALQISCTNRIGLVSALVAACRWTGRETWVATLVRRHRAGTLHELWGVREGETAAVAGGGHRDKGGGGPGVVMSLHACSRPTGAPGPKLPLQICT